MTSLNLVNLVSKGDDNMDKYLKDTAGKILLFLKENIHTILLLIGIGFIDHAGFLFGAKAGFITTGLSLISISLLLNYGEQRR